MLTNNLLIFAIACIFTALLTLPVKYLCIYLGIVDQPDGRRKLHQKITPLGGGLAVYVGCLTTIILYYLFDKTQQFNIQEKFLFTIGLITSCTLICFVGIVDDAIKLRGRQKLLGQIGSALIITMCGLQVQHINVFGLEINLGIMAIPVTIVWLLVTINALNLIDGIDGLATSIGLILSLAIGLIAIFQQRFYEASIAFSMAGALCGFLFFNFPPAKMFLGDAGSMLIGLLMGALAIRCSLKGPATMALSVPIAIWTIPIFDVAMAVIRRKLTGRSIYTTDRGHIHHVFQQHGYSNKKILGIIATLCLITCTGAFIGLYQHNEWVAFGSAILVMMVLIITRAFGYAELLLLIGRTRSFASTLIPSLRNLEDSNHGIQAIARIQGTREWDELWKSLVEYAQRFSFTRVRLNVNIPLLHEEFHADWHISRSGNEDAWWSTSLPICIKGVVHARLMIGGLRTDDFNSQTLSDLIEGLKPFETQMIDLIEELISQQIQAGNTTKVPEIQEEPVLINQ